MLYCNFLTLSRPINNTKASLPCAMPKIATKSKISRIMFKYPIDIRYFRVVLLMFKLKKGEIASAADGVGSANNLFVVHTTEISLCVLAPQCTPPLCTNNFEHYRWNYTWRKEVDRPTPRSHADRNREAVILFKIASFSKA